MPEEEKNPVEIKKNLKSVKPAIVLGALVVGALLVLWVIPYLNGLG